MARIGKLDILWSVNKLARSVTKWTQACDRRLARLISEENESVGELSTVCSQIVLKCLQLARIGRRSDILWSVKCACYDKMDKISWQVNISNIVLWEHSTTIQIRTVSRLWFCRRLWTLKINIRRNSVHFRKSHVCANKLDVQETNFSFTQFYRSWNHFSWCRFTHGRYSHSHSLGFSDWSSSFRAE